MTLRSVVQRLDTKGSGGRTKSEGGIGICITHRQLYIHFILRRYQCLERSTTQNRRPRCHPPSPLAFVSVFSGWQELREGLVKGLIKNSKVYN